VVRVSVTTYFERIRESLFDQFVIETLSEPPSEEIAKTGRRKVGV
jgi:hypothetical protein